jgi:hypothetical protein
MKKRNLSKIVLIVLFIFSTISVFAQENQTTPKPTFKRHEFNVSVGVFNTIGMNPLLNQGKPIPLFSYSNNSDLLFYKIGSFNVEYNLNLLKFYSIGGSLSYTYTRERDVTYQNGHAIFFHINSHFISIFINNKFNYVNKKSYKMYSGFGIGLTKAIREPNVTFTPKNIFYFNFQLCLIGISLTNKYPLFFELGIGPQGIFKVGVNF